MPKITIGKDRIDEQIDATSKQIRVAIVTAETMRNVSRAETIKRSGMSSANFYKAWKDPSLFRIGQLIRIYDFLKVPEPERRFT